MAARMGVGVPRILLLSVDDTDILDLEEFRGLVPDEDDTSRAHPTGGFKSLYAPINLVVFFLVR